MTRARYRILPHTADVRLAVSGETEEELLGNAVVGTLAVALGRPPRGTPTGAVFIRPWPAAPDQRLVTVANEAIFLLYSRGLLVLGVNLSGGGAELAVRPRGPRDEPQTEIKAATFHDLRPRREGRRWRAVLVLDV